MFRAFPGHGRSGGGPLWRHLPAGPSAGTGLPWRSSLLIAVVVMAGSHVAAQNQVGDRVPLDVAGRFLLLAGPALLLLRHRLPRTTVFATAVVCLLYLGAGYPYGPVFLSVVVAVFSAVVAGHRFAAWGALAVLGAGHLLLGLWWYHWLPPVGDDGVSLWEELVVGAWLVVVVPVAELARVRHEQWARDREERAREEQRRAERERLRIARELHDVLAHSISVINVQAGVGLALLDTDPEQARDALTTIRTAGRQALGEVRQVLETLRAPDGAASRSPAPGLERLPELVEHAGSAGLRVTTRTTGTPAPLPSGTDLAAFRIVQEALTNVLRHSAARRARVTLQRGGDTLEVLVEDDGPASGGDTGGSGNGLAGMRERAAVLGGTLEAGPRSGGGFRVRAVLPVGYEAESQAAKEEDA
ncbi:sensor histidine kinase [Streptomyces sp. TR06-5]|uniref:sensor histidine kinase n=1 Tax=unclassified Streptomyces TaxID=2593676 RepID=UPI0039A26E37